MFDQIRRYDGTSSMWFTSCNEFAADGIGFLQMRRRKHTKTIPHKGQVSNHIRLDAPLTLVIQRPIGTIRSHTEIEFLNGFTENG